jgi:ABC-2 type transport system permease protein
MPIFDQGYQHWHGKLSGQATRWLAVARRGARIQLRNRRVKFTVLGALVPGLVLAGAMVVWGLFEQKSSLLTPLMALMQELPDEIKAGPKHYRAPAWALAFTTFFDVQTFFAMLLVLFVGQDLISQDLRFNAMPLYFSRPVRRFDYFLGKFGVIGIYVAAVAILPFVLAYFLGLCFSFDLAVLRDTGRLFAAGIGYGALIALSTGALMLAFSSLSRNSRYVGAIWVGLWLVGGIMADVLTETVGSRWAPLVSYTGNLRRVGQTLLDREWALQQFQALARRQPFHSVPQPSAPPIPWYWSALVLAGLFGLSLWILTSRIKTLDRLR